MGGWGWGLSVWTRVTTVIVAGTAEPTDLPRLSLPASQPRSRCSRHHLKTRPAPAVRFRSRGWARRLRSPPLGWAEHPSGASPSLPPKLASPHKRRIKGRRSFKQQEGVLHPQQRAAVVVNATARLVVVEGRVSLQQLACVLSAMRV